MKPNPHVPHFARPAPMTLAERLSLSPEGVARRSLRRRLLKYIVETHRRREAARRRGLPMGNA